MFTGTDSARHTLNVVVIGGVAGVLFVLAQIQDDTMLRASYSRLSEPGGTAALVISALSFLGNLAYSLARVPLTQVRLLADQPAALWPAVGVGACLLTALALERSSRVTAANARLFSFGILAGSIAFQIWFFRFGTDGWGTGNDWEKDRAYYLAAGDAVRNLQMPYYIRMLQQGTERYIANLETPFAPHLLMLAVVTPSTFYVAHVVTCLAAGFVAIVRLRDRLQLSLFWWTTFVVLFVMNGNILSHLGAGHTQWAGYFLLPWVYLTLLHAHVAPRPRDMVALALALSAMIAIGSWHVFVWAVILSLGFTASRPALIPWVLKAFALVAALASFRLLPALVTFGAGDNIFLLSYQSPGQLIAALTGGPLPDTGLHEYDLFVGWGGFAVLCAGLLPRSREDSRPARSLWMASALMILLSMPAIYERTLFNLPGFVSQRVVTRLAVVGVLGLLLLAGRRLSVWLPPARIRFAVAAGLAVVCVWVAMQLALHAEAVRPAVHYATPGVSPLKSVAVEPVYWWAVWIGVTCSAAALAGAAMIWRRSTD